MMVRSDWPFGENSTVRNKRGCEVSGVNWARRSTDTRTDCCDVLPPGKYTNVPVSLTSVLDAAVVARMGYTLGDEYR